jgi:hypothetical protein
MNGTVGPSIRTYGDIAAGDFEYFGATSAAGVEVQQIGVRIQGAFPSLTELKAVRREQGNVSSKKTRSRPNSSARAATVVRLLAS